MFVVRSRAERTLPLFEYWMNISCDVASQFLPVRCEHIVCVPLDPATNISSSNSSSSSYSNAIFSNLNATNEVFFLFWCTHRVCTRVLFIPKTKRIGTQCLCRIFFDLEMYFECVCEYFLYHNQMKWCDEFGHAFAWPSYTYWPSIRKKTQKVWENDRRRRERKKQRLSECKKCRFTNSEHSSNINLNFKPIIRQKS